jgi:hypothetical protein
MDNVFKQLRIARDESEHTHLDTRVVKRYEQVVQLSHETTGGRTSFPEEVAITWYLLEVRAGCTRSDT